jgi:hypothetical protein
VLPAAQVALRPPLQLIVHALPAPQVILQLELPAQSAVHPPCGQSMVQALSPVQAIVEPEPSETEHSLPPAHDTVLFVPVESVQELVPAHDDVQSERQLPLHVDCPSQVVVQPVPHVAVQVFFDSQS